MRSRTLWLALVVVGAIVALWLDLSGPVRPRAGGVDPVALARIEAEAWRAAAARDEARQFRAHVRMLRAEHHLPLLRAYRQAYRATRAASVFKSGRARTEYERALPDLERYYEGLRGVRPGSFDPVRAARYELEWWILHRQRAEHALEERAAALAALQAEVYGVPAGRVAEHARLRAEALALRDDQLVAGGVSNAHWDRIEALLQAAWRSLAQATVS